jgi:hypothetical protein
LGAEAPTTGDAVGREVASRPPIYARLAAPAAIVAIVGWATVVFGKVLFGPWALFWHDVSIFNLPLRSCLAQLADAGHFPFWSWLYGSGYPVAYDPQSGLGYPLQADLVPWMSIARGYAVTAWLHVILAGLGVRVLLRIYRVSIPACLLAALAYMGSGVMGGHVMHVHVLFPIAWLPWAMAAVVWLWRRPSLPAALLAGVPIGLAVLAGHPQYAFYVYSAYVLWVLIAPLPEGGPTRGTAILWAIVPMFFGALLGLGPYLAGLSLVPSSLRTQAGPRGDVFDMSLDLAHLPLIVHPFLLGSYANNNYFGGAHHYEVCGFVAAPALVLAILAFAAAPKERRRLVWAFAAIAAFGLAMALARNNPLYDVLRRLPMLGSFRAHARWVMVFCLGASLLASMGVDALRGDRWRKPALVLGLLSLLMWAAVPAMVRGAEHPIVRILASHLPEQGPAADRQAKAVEKYHYLASQLSWTDPYWAAYGVTGVALLLVASAPAVGIGLVLAATALIGGLYFASYLPAVPMDYYRKPPATALAMLRTPGPVWVDPACPENLRPPASYRGWAREGTDYYMKEREVLRPNRPLLWGIESARIINPLSLGDEVQVLDDLVPTLLADAKTRPAGYTLLASLGIRWVVTLPDQGPPGAAPVARTMQSALFAVPDAQASLRLCSGTTSAQLLGVRLNIPGANVADGQVRAERKPGPELLVAQVAAPRPALLLLGMPAYPILRASVDGSRALFVRYDGYMAAVAVPDGKHEVRVSLNTSPLRRGMLLYGLAWLMALLALVLVIVRRRPRPR